MKILIIMSLIFFISSNIYGENTYYKNKNGNLEVIDEYGSKLDTTKYNRYGEKKIVVEDGDDLSVYDTTSDGYKIIYSKEDAKFDRNDIIRNKEKFQDTTLSYNYYGNIIKHDIYEEKEYGNHYICPLIPSPIYYLSWNFKNMYLKNKYNYCSYGISYSGYSNEYIYNPESDSYIKDTTKMERNSKYFLFFNLNYKFIHLNSKISTNTVKLFTGFRLPFVFNLKDETISNKIVRRHFFLIINMKYYEYNNNFKTKDKHRYFNFNELYKNEIGLKFSYYTKRDLTDSEFSDMDLFNNIIISLSYTGVINKYTSIKFEIGTSFTINRIKANR